MFPLEADIFRIKPSGYTLLASALCPYWEMPLFGSGTEADMRLLLKLLYKSLHPKKCSKLIQAVFTETKLA